MPTGSTWSTATRDRSPRGLTGGSRALPVGGSALHEASLKIIDKGKQIAANLLEASAVDIEYGDGQFRIVGTDRHVDLFDVAKAAQDPAKLPPGMEPGLDTTQVQNPAGATFPNGCHIAEVEIDPDSGVTTILRYTVVDDFGAVINPMLLEGQVHGGIVQGIGQALLEETVYDEDSGQLLTGTFMDYAMPRADDLPYFSFSTRNVPCKANPLGIKGAGEAGAIGAPPALINAIVDALHHKGVRHIDMPATPKRVWEAIHAAVAACTAPQLAASLRMRTTAAASLAISPQRALRAPAMRRCQNGRSAQRRSMRVVLAQRLAIGGEFIGDEPPIAARRRYRRRAQRRSPIAYEAKMPERSALKMPCPDTGSKHEAASPTHSSGSDGVAR